MDDVLIRDEVWSFIVMSVTAAAIERVVQWLLSSDRRDIVTHWQNSCDDMKGCSTRDEVMERLQKGNYMWSDECVVKCYQYWAYVHVNGTYTKAHLNTIKVAITMFVVRASTVETAVNINPKHIFLCFTYFLAISANNQTILPRVYSLVPSFLLSLYTSVLLLVSALLTFSFVPSSLFMQCMSTRTLNRGRLRRTSLLTRYTMLRPTPHMIY